MQRNKILSAKTLQIITVISTIVVFSGCAASRLTRQARAGIRSVSISSNVSIPSEIEYFKDDIKPGSPSNFMGALMAIDDVMQDTDLNVGKIVVEEFKEQLAAKQVFPSIVNFGGDANFSFKIHFYGLRPRAFAPEGHLGGVLKVTVYLRKANGKLIWKSTADCSPERTSAYLWRKYITEPKLLRMVFKQAAHAVVSDLFKDID